MQRTQLGRAPATPSGAGPAADPPRAGEQGKDARP